ncbi:hypothetical protein UFOVP1619_14 [uncultured Caudovirales phage]|uniref:Uncharacterized protein n=1 Tax=uncultured Caudovirales phage TaxID=2100421 RepID=A0A6J5SVA4_9CAUD|nr:hypothetical protein UFOVP1619_14 [uncultured Caudovirales phage]
MTALDLFRRLAARVEPLDHIQSEQLLAICTLPDIVARLETMSDQLGGMLAADALDKCEMRGLQMALLGAADDVRENHADAAGARRVAGLQDRARRLFGCRP